MQPLFQLESVYLDVPANEVNILEFALQNRRELHQSRPLLQDINLCINVGERIGVIGHNGAGKTTLMRLLAGIYPPSRGQYYCRCSPHSLFSVTQGFLQNCTGLENIYIRGLTLGLSHKEIRAQIPYIYRFSRLKREELVRKISTYSTGMQLKLAIAVTLAFKGDFFILDEWIGAGDAAFREIIDKKLIDLINEGKGAVIASHNTRIIRDFCTRVLVIERGRIVYDGDPMSGLKML